MTQAFYTTQPSDQCLEFRTENLGASLSSFTDCLNPCTWLILSSSFTYFLPIKQPYKPNNVIQVHVPLSPSITLRDIPFMMPTTSTGIQWAAVSWPIRYLTSIQRTCTYISLQTHSLESLHPTNFQIHCPHSHLVPHWFQSNCLEPNSYGYNSTCFFVFWVRVSLLVQAVLDLLNIKGLRSLLGWYTKAQ